MRNKILSFILGILGGLAICSCILTDKRSETQYPRLLQVSAAQEDGGILYVWLKDCNGFTYKTVMEDLDFELGDFYDCIMSDNATNAIYDDYIISMRYSRPDLFFK